MNSVFREYRTYFKDGALAVWIRSMWLKVFAR